MNTLLRPLGLLLLLVVVTAFHAGGGGGHRHVPRGRSVARGAAWATASSYSIRLPTASASDGATLTTSATASRIGSERIRHHGRSSIGMGSSSTGLAAATKATDVETYRKKEIVAMVVEETGLSKADAGKAVDAVLESIVESIADGKKVNFVGFGSFSPRSRAARKGRNPKTGEEMDIKASNSVGFTAGKSFKERLNQ